MGGLNRIVLLAAALCLLLPACSSQPSGEQPDAAAFVDGDLAAIREQGELRILLPRRLKDPQLPRKGNSLDFERELAVNFARDLGVKPVEIFVDSRDRLIPDLLAGRGDIIAANLTVTAERRQRVAFSVPVAVVREQLVTRAEDINLSAIKDLGNRRIALRPSSSFWGTVSRLRERRPGIEIVEVEENVDTEEIIHRVAIGEYDLTVADSNLVEACLEYRDDIRVALDLTRDRPIGLAVRPTSPNLLEILNSYLTEAQLTDRADEVHLEDFAGIKQRRVLRMLTRNNAASYFLWRGELMGFEYDLVGEFARRNNLRLEIIVPPVGEDLLPWLQEGRGDLVAAALTPSDERREGGVEFTRPYNYVSQVIVKRADDNLLQKKEDLAGRSVHVRPSSAYRKTLEALREEGIAVEIVAAPEELETEEIIAMVASGEYDLTLSDSHILEIELNWRDDVQPAFALSDSEPLAWAVREANPELKSALDRFIREEYRGLYYNVIYEKYFRDTGKIRTRRQQEGDERAGLSPYDEIAKKYAEKYGFDWRDPAKHRHRTRLRGHHRSGERHPCRRQVPRLGKGPFRTGAVGAGPHVVHARRLQRGSGPCARRQTPGCAARTQPEQLVRQRRAGDAAALPAAVRAGGAAWLLPLDRAGQVCPGSQITVQRLRRIDRVDSGLMTSPVAAQQPS